MRQVLSNPPHRQEQPAHLRAAQASDWGIVEHTTVLQPDAEDEAVAHATHHGGARHAEIVSDLPLGQQRAISRVRGHLLWDGLNHGARERGECESQIVTVWPSGCNLRPRSDGTGSGKFGPGRIRLSFLMVGRVASIRSFGTLADARQDF